MRKISIDIQNKLFERKLKNYIVDHYISDHEINFTKKDSVDLIITDDPDKQLNHQLNVTMAKEDLKTNEIFMYSSGDIYINKIEKLIHNRIQKPTKIISFITDYQMVLKEKVIEKTLKHLNNNGYKILLISFLTFPQEQSFTHEFSNLIFNYSPDQLLKDYLQQDQKLNVDYLVGLNHINDYYDFNQLPHLIRKIKNNTYDYVFFNHNNVLDRNSIVCLTHCQDIFYISTNQSNYKKMLNFLDNNAVDTDKCQYLNYRILEESHLSVDHLCK